MPRYIVLSSDRFRFGRNICRNLFLKGNVSNFYNAMGGSILSTNLVLAVNSGLWSYDGWDSLNFGVEELKNPKRYILQAEAARFWFLTAF